MEIEDITNMNVEIEDPDDCVEVEEQKDPQKSLKRKRKLRSQVCDHFDRLVIKNTNGENVIKAKCKYCEVLINSDSKYGTGHLKRHTTNCVRKNTRDIGQMLIGGENGSMLMRSSKFSEEKFRELLISAIVMHNMPLSFVEYGGFRTVFSYLKDDVPTISRNTAKADMVKLHQREKNKIKFMLDETPGRKLDFAKKNLEFSYMPPPHNGIALSEKVYGLLADWKIESKLFAVTLDNASANDTFVDYFQLQLNARNVLLDDGKYFHLRCYAHILNLIVQEGLKEVDIAVKKVRESVKYVKGSQVRKQKFLECVSLVSLNTKRGLRQDVPTRWNSTYLMLQSALYFRMAFSHLEISDSNYKHCPSKDEWDRIEKLSKFLGVFYEITCVFSGTKYPTTNLYFPAIFKARLTLEEQKNGDDLGMRNMAIQMFAKFEKYWSAFSLILAIAVILDPRYKIHFVDWSYKKLYGHDSMEFKKVKESLFSLYREYANKISPRHVSSNYMNLGNDSVGTGIMRMILR
ncbi:PREDICTED: zinc finger BED domain-containing protein RICESLEEPER 2-like [Ipomoea nil]|uniref:zinc finger BED domain-containing protein RICESLEEPER 2-like n=1 Tax=Ipomoea nil TaxID=35883 RepID=UPI000900DF1A|nr:PREDICTED: zinc finger BED domain-containing protein RICESLEEPER 2-like [Ipomoea nil]